MIAQTAPRTERRIRRAVLLTSGPAAAAVAAEMLTLSRTWLGVEPPLAIVHFAAQGDAEGGASATLNALSLACERLVSGEAIGRLQTAGYALARPDEIQLWMLVEVAANAGDCFAETARNDVARVAEMPMLMSRLADTAWRRWRIHVTLRGLLLAEPATEASAAKWALGLTDAGAEQVFVAGPVDAERLCWNPGAWQTRTATAVATLLWSGVALQLPPGLANREESAEKGSAAGVWSIGAAAWQAPLAQIKRHVATRCALGMVERLIGKDQTFEVSETSKVLWSDDLPPWEMPGLAVAPERHRLILESTVPPEAPAQMWGGQRPDWGALPKLPEAMRTTAEKRVVQAHEEQYILRGEWLGKQVAHWQTDLDQLRQERLTSTTGWPRVGLYCLELEALVVQLQAACVTIEDWLEEAGQQFEAAAAEATQALQDLEQLCAGFPAATWTAAWAILRRPWRWLTIAWAYWIMLPRYAQKCLDAAYRQGQARWIEANTHALRQAYLAMAQVTHDHQDEVKELFATLVKAQAELAGELEGLGEPPEPWRAAELQQLVESLTPRTWPAALALAPKDLAACIAKWVEERLDALTAWKAADCLAGTLTDAELMQWLGSLAEAALPLWPESEYDAATALWLIWPSGAAGRGYHSVEERMHLSVQAWASLHTQGQLQVHSAEGSASALLVLRATAVRLDGQE